MKIPTIQQISKTLSTYRAYQAYFILGLTAFLIWALGPFLSFGDYAPLADPEKRFYLILLVLLSWVLKIQFWDDTKPASLEKKAGHPELLKRLQTLEGRVLGAIDFLKKTLVQKNGDEASLHHLPWYLLLGPDNAGKTTLLANANVQFILSKQFKNDVHDIPKSENCDFWVTRECVLVDVPGHFLQAPTKHASQFGHHLWQNFLNLLKKHRGNESLRGVILTLPLPDILKQTSQSKDRFLEEIRQSLNALKEKYGKSIPVYLTVTKCDLLPGFLDFFGDSGSEEISQAWGITLPKVQQSEKLLEIFQNRFNALIKRLNKQLIWRLHQERSAATRTYIKDFPLQIERLKESIFILLKNLNMNPEQLALQGVYLTSAIQPPEEVGPKTHIQSGAGNAGQALQILKNPSMPSRPYFVKQFLSQGLAYSNEIFKSASFSWKQTPKVYYSLLAIVIAFAFILGKGLIEGIQQTSQLRNALAEYQDERNLEGGTLINAMPLLKALNDAADPALHRSFLQSEDALQSASAAYIKALQGIVLPDLKTTFEDYLQATSNKPTGMTYRVLKAYLMLGDKQRMQTNYVADTFQEIYPAVTQKNHIALMKEVHAALESAWHPIILDPDLITKVRKSLDNLSATDIAYFILQNMPNNQTLLIVNLGAEEKSPLHLNTEYVNQVPALFTADTFQANDDLQMNQAAALALQNNWVLGSTQSSSANQNSLTTDLHTLYFDRYARAWEKILGQIQMTQANNFLELDALLLNISDAHSPLLQLLKTVKQNTHFSPILSRSEQLAGLNRLLANSMQEPSMETITKILHKLQVDVHTLAEAKDIHRAAILIASSHAKDHGNDPLSRLNEIAKISPEPMKTWLTQIANTYWHLLKQNAGQALEAHTDTPTTDINTSPAKLAENLSLNNEAAHDLDIKELNNLFNKPSQLGIAAS